MSIPKGQREKRLEILMIRAGLNECPENERRAEQGQGKGGDPDALPAFPYPMGQGCGGKV